MNHKSFAMALLMAVALVAAPPGSATENGPASGPASDTKSPAGEQLAALLAAADEADLRLNPLNGLQRGDLRRAGEYDDISDKHFRELESTLREQLEGIRRIERPALSPNERIAYDVFRYQVERDLRGFDAGLVRVRQQLPIDHFLGAHITFAQLASGEGIAAFRTLADYDSGLQRIDGYVAYLGQAISLMRRGIRAGHVQPRVVTRKVIGQLESTLAQSVEDSPYYRPIRNLPEDFAATDKARLSEAYRAAIAGKLRPATSRLLDFMRSEYLPASRGGPPGLASMHDGAGLYALMLRELTTTEMTADEIHRLGLAEVARIRGEMNAIRQRTGYAGSLRQMFSRLQNDARFQFDTRDALMGAYRAVGQRVDAALPGLFRALPRGGFEIRPVPAEQENSAGGAYYQIGTPDGKRPGIFYVNTSNLPTRNASRTTALFLHEALPGHHLQGSLAQEDAALPALLRFGWNAGYSEGWALYCEWLGREMGLYDNPFQGFGQLDMEMFRAARLVVDSGLHAKAWDRERAIRYMLDNTSLDRAAVTQEVDRYIVWPGQATAYKVGELFIKRLRTKAENRLGARFDIREFHAQVLGSGAIPLAVLERKIDDWIARSAGG